MKDSCRAVGMRTVMPACALAVLLMVLQAFCAAPVQPIVDWRADAFTINTEENTVDASGNVEFTYEAEHKAVMTCPRAHIELGEEEGQVARMAASGPVEAEVTTKGRYPKHITAKCDSATYVCEPRTETEPGTEMITLLGNVVGTMRQPDPAAKVRGLQFRGGKMVVDLKAGTFAIERGKEKQATGTFTLPEKKPEEPKGEKTPEKEQPK